MVEQTNKEILDRINQEFTEYQHQVELSEKHLKFVVRLNQEERDMDKLDSLLKQITSKIEINLNN
ncbi:hypothetical protein [Sodaliphilus pleomorphus]|uniref:Uncharacterized protein n=1 Tax=Sodaliphilus pleomorphus TaxID=2606626 RepID=A0A6L5XH56_9BACT|nr:hypothetical protein [Sodaliphilus pleomorphus]MSS18768.1 hypothetical protein [Sodaliphilus pleomorphus]